MCSRRFRHALAEHEVRTVPEMGWTSFKNGVLLATASGRFDIFVTTDQRLSYQQNIADLQIAVVVLVAKRNKLEFLLPLVPTLKRALAEIKAGEMRRVGA